MSLRELGQRERVLLRLYSRCQLGMSPRDFYAKWNVTHAQMAQICCCSQPTVDRWFSRGSTHRSPDPLHCRRLAEMDLLWELYEQIPATLREQFCPPQHPSNQNLSP
jgi:hypothetical protein